MTDDVAAASLRNNYQQGLALSLAERRSARELADYSLLMRMLEARGLIERPLEALPSDIELQERARAARGLTRPELAVLLSYAKIALQHDLLESQRARRAAGSSPGSPAISRPPCASASPATSTSTACAARSSPSGSPTPSSTAAARPMAVRLAEETQRTHGRRRLRLPGRARGVRAAGAVAAHRRARRQGQGRRPARPLPGDAGPRERADAVVPAQWRGHVGPRRHHRPPPRRRRPR